MSKLVLGVFDDYMSANGAYADLLARGFSDGDVSVITREETVKNIMDQTRDTAKGIAGATVTGGVVGGLIGILTGIGALTIPGIGGLFIAGPVSALLGLTGAVAVTASGALTGALAGGIVGVLKELGLDELNARAIEDRIKEGAVLLVVEATDAEVSMANDIFRQNSAENISELQTND